MEKVIKKGSTVTKVLIWKGRDENGYDQTECELKFSDGSYIKYECNDVDELENEHKGIYECLEDGSYIQIEDWE